MRNVSIMCLIAIFIASSTVYGEVVKAATTTTIIEKATQPIAPVASSDAAIINPVPVNGYDCMYVAELQVRKIHWAVDENFYANGYKALLNKGVKVIIAPPDNRQNTKRIK